MKRLSEDKDAGYWMSRQKAVRSNREEEEMILGICLGIWGGLLWIAYLSRKEQGELLQRMSNYLYKLCCVYKLPFVEGQRVSMDLERLHPGVSCRELQMDYYTEKLRLVILVLFAGSLLTGMLGIKVHMDKSLSSQAVLERGDVGEGEREVYLIAEVGGEREEIGVNVVERQLREEELKILFEDCVRELEEWIPGENESLEAVAKPLRLPDSMEGYPFEIQWKSSEPTLVGQDGEIRQENREAGKTVLLTATLSYGEQSYTKEFLVQPAAGEYEQSLLYKLQEAVWQKDEESRYEEKLSLPQELDGDVIRWQLKPEDNSPVFLLLTLVAAVGVFVLKDKDLHEQTLERKRSLKMAYPGILNKFVLYMGAGLTVRGSFLKVANDYRKGMQTGGKNIAYEEMLYSCNELSTGVSEGLVYERFGKRSGLQEYTRFATMLGQNLKKGNSALLVRLREESEKAMAEDLQFRKKLGEEAETKLLIPMIMMLGIVMLLVMIPAFTAFE